MEDSATVEMNLQKYSVQRPSWLDDKLESLTKYFQQKRVDKLGQLEQLNHELQIVELKDENFQYELMNRQSAKKLSIALKHNESLQDSLVSVSQKTHYLKILLQEIENNTSLKRNPIDTIIAFENFKSIIGKHVNELHDEAIKKLKFAKMPEPKHLQDDTEIQENELVAPDESSCQQECIKCKEHEINELNLKRQVLLLKNQCKGFKENLNQFVEEYSQLKSTQQLSSDVVDEIYEESQNELSASNGVINLSAGTCDKVISRKKESSDINQSVIENLLPYEIAKLRTYKVENILEYILSKYVSECLKKEIFINVGQTNSFFYEVDLKTHDLICQIALVHKNQLRSNTTKSLETNHAYIVQLEQNFNAIDYMEYKETSQRQNPFCMGHFKDSRSPSNCHENNKNAIQNLENKNLQMKIKDLKSKIKHRGIAIKKILKNSIDRKNCFINIINKLLNCFERVLADDKCDGMSDFYFQTQNFQNICKQELVETIEKAEFLQLLDTYSERKIEEKKIIWLKMKDLSTELQLEIDNLSKILQFNICEDITNWKENFFENRNLIDSSLNLASKKITTTVNLLNIDPESIFTELELNKFKLNEFSLRLSKIFTNMRSEVSRS